MPSTWAFFVWNKLTNDTASFDTLNDVSLTEAVHNNQGQNDKKCAGVDNRWGVNTRCFKARSSQRGGNGYDVGHHVVCRSGKEHGGVLSHDINSMLVSSFKDMEKIDITQIRKIYRTLSNLCNMNVLKVLVAFFENNNNGLSDNGLTVAELSKMTHLTVDQVYEAMNNLDVIINDKANKISNIGNTFFIYSHPTLIIAKKKS